MSTSEPAEEKPEDVQKILLSQTYETSQLVSPEHLERITIDDPQ